MKREKKKKLSFQSEDSLGSMGDLFGAAGFCASDEANDSNHISSETSASGKEQQVIIGGGYRIRKERKGRAGKTVTIVSDLALTSDDLKRLAKRMKQSLGCGASIENDEIILQGDIEERIRRFFDKKM